MKFSCLSWLGFVCLVSLSFGQGASIQEKTLAFNKLSSSNLIDRDIAALTDVLISSIIVDGVYQVLEPLKVEGLLKEQGFQHSGFCNDEFCAIEIGQLLGVEYVGIGSIALIGKTYAVSARIVEVRTGKIIRDVNQFFKGSRDDLVMEVLPQIARKLSGLEPVTGKVKKRSKRWIIGVSAAGLAAIAVPVVIVIGKKNGLWDK